ncbi:hypothetical protein ACOSQ2_005511 [Xanthoceras sorbifolium]
MDPGLLKMEPRASLPPTTPKTLGLTYSINHNRQVIRPFMIQMQHSSFKKSLSPLHKTKEPIKSFLNQSIQQKNLSSLSSIRIGSLTLGIRTTKASPKASHICPFIKNYKDCRNQL